MAERKGILSMIWSSELAKMLDSIIHGKTVIQKSKCHKNLSIDNIKSDIQTCKLTGFQLFIVKTSKTSYEVKCEPRSIPDLRFSWSWVPKIILATNKLQYFKNVYEIAKFF